LETPPWNRDDGYVVVNVCGACGLQGGPAPVPIPAEGRQVSRQEMMMHDDGNATIACAICGSLGYPPRFGSPARVAGRSVG
jgi:hypothetical protein